MQWLDEVLSGFAVSGRSGALNFNLKRTKIPIAI